MSLPIPAIMKNASDVLIVAKKILTHLDSVDYDELNEALKKVSPDDLLAVMNEVGRVYVGIHNIQILSVGWRPNPQTKGIDMALDVEYGLGRKTIILSMPPKMAQDVVKNFNDALVATNFVGDSLILPGGGNA